jgi:hypothetical protein
MDYKSVLEGQIRELEKVQDKIIKESGHADESCRVAETIKDLCNEVRTY